MGKNDYVEINFEDDAVDCVSSGGFTSSMKATPKANINLDQVIDQTQKEKQLNFYDDDVDCTSEGGNWSLPVDSVSTTFTPSVQPKKKLIELLLNVLSTTTNSLSYQANALDITKLCDEIDIVEFNEQSIHNYLTSKKCYWRLVKHY